MANTIVSKANIIAMLKKSITDHVQCEMDRAIDVAQEKIEEELKKKVDSIALFLLRQYDVYRDGQNIVISVKMENKP